MQTKKIHRAAPAGAVFVLCLLGALSALAPLRTGAEEAKELPCHPIPNLGEAAEWYFSPDGRSLIGDAKGPGDSVHHVYIASLDGSDIRRINGKGEDACTFFMPDGRHIIWTSTRDWPDLPKGNYSNPDDYPQGAEIYCSDLWGRNIKRLTSNKVYDAECVSSPDGTWILFTRQIEGRLDLWTMTPDGQNQKQITFTEDWQEGGSQVLPDGETIITRAWKRQDQGRGRGPMPMQIFTLKRDGSGRRQVTTDEGTHWAPFPAPDGRHFVYVRVVTEPGGRPNWEIYLRDLVTGGERRLTFDPAFDGFPSISADGRWMTISSSRGAKPGERTLHQFLMDISSLKIGPPAKR